jgi:hypothetical protein
MVAYWKRIHPDEDLKKWVAAWKRKPQTKRQDLRAAILGDHALQSFLLEKGVSNQFRDWRLTSEQLRLAQPLLTARGAMSTVKRTVNVTQIITRADHQKRPSRADKLAQFFRERPNRWISALDLKPIGGQLSWRSRVADLRRAPYNLNIQNRQRMVRREDGTHVSISEYKNEVEVVERRHGAENGTAPPLLF